MGSGERVLRKDANRLSCGQRVLVVVTGQEGVATALFCAARGGANVTATDTRTEKESAKRSPRGMRSP